MAPFRAYRFNPEKFEDLSLVLTPPYDVISPDGQKEYHDRHPNNIIRVDYALDTPGENKYDRAAKTLNEWINNKTLAPDPEPAVYITEQEFINLDGQRRYRRGFTCLLKLEKFGKGKVYPHEKTFPKHKVDRLALLQAARAQFNPIFMIFSDRKKTVSDIIDAATDGPAESEFIADDGSINRLWRVTDKKTLKTLGKLMQERPVFIADGHHRYETALNFRKETKQKLGKLPKDHPARFALCYFTPIEAPGLEMTSPHRLLRNIPDFSADKIPELLGKRFTIEQIEKSDAAPGCAEISKRNDRNSFALQAGNQFFILTPKSKKAIKSALPEDMPGFLKQLDVNICTYTIIHPLIGADADILNHVGFEVDAKKACKFVESGEYQAVIYIPPSKMEQIIDVIAAKEVLPHKTTYFYPKLPTGLVIYHLNME